VCCRQEIIYSNSKHLQKKKQTLSSTAGPSWLGSCATYTGAGRSSMFAKQANLQKAAKGSGDITLFFTKKVHIESPGPATAC